VVLVPPAERRTASAAIEADRGYVYVPPFDAPDVIAGQGTTGLEILADLATDADADAGVDTVLVPVSGGGLISGIATAVKGLRPEVRVIGVEPELAADARESLHSGELVRWPPELTYRTIADGLRMTLSPLTWRHVLALVDDIVTVTEDEIRAAVRLLATGSRLVVEPSGAVTTAAYRFHHAELPPGRNHVAVVSGGNIDPDLLASILTG